MNKELKIRENETLDAWCSRIALYLSDTKKKYFEINDILREVSVTSYIHGSNDALSVIKR